RRSRPCPRLAQPAPPPVARRPPHLSRLEGTRRDHRQRDVLQGADRPKLSRSVLLRWGGVVRPLLLVLRARQGLESRQEAYREHESEPPKSQPSRRHRLQPSILSSPTTSAIAPNFLRVCDVPHISASSVLCRLQATVSC